MKPWKKQHWRWERDNKQQTLKWVIFHWKYNIPTIQEVLTPPRLPAFHPPAEMSLPVESAGARRAGARYDGNNPAVVLQWYTEGWDSCTCTSESWRTSQWWMWERCAASALHACFCMSTSKRRRISRTPVHAPPSFVKRSWTSWVSGLN